MIKLSVILPAAGVGKRFFGDEPSGEARNKVELDLAGKAIFVRAIDLFLNREQTRQILVAIQPDQIDLFRMRWGDKLAFHGVELIPGGTVDRWETVMKALAMVRDDCTHVAVHDAARPLPTKALIDRVFEAAELYPAVIPAIDVSATLKRVAPLDSANDEEKDSLDALLKGTNEPAFDVRQVMETVDRRQLVAVQTPQVFDLSLVRKAYAQIDTGALDTSAITDDAGLIESLGKMVHVVPGEAGNLKITTPEDMELATAICTQREASTKAELSRKRLFADEDD